jgi:hypothetical protein
MRSWICAITPTHPRPPAKTWTPHALPGVEASAGPRARVFPSAGQSLDSKLPLLGVEASAGLRVRSLPSVGKSLDSRPPFSETRLQPVSECGVFPRCARRRRRNPPPRRWRSLFLPGRANLKAGSRVRSRSNEPPDGQIARARYKKRRCGENLTGRRADCLCRPAPGAL